MNGKVFNVMSLIPQNGAKYVTSNLGFFMKKKFKNKKILLIDFDFENPTLYYHFIKDSVYSIDDLISIEKSLDRNSFYNNIIKTEFKVDIFKGSGLGTANLFSKELIAIILNFAKEMYDYIFVVTSSDVNNSAIIMTLLNADKVILVVRNNYSNLLKIDKKLKEINTFVKDKSIIKIVANFNNYNQEMNILDKVQGYSYLSLLDFVSKSIDNRNLKEKFFIKRKTINDRKFKEIIKELIK